MGCGSEIKKVTRKVTRSIKKVAKKTWDFTTDPVGETMDAFGVKGGIRNEWDNIHDAGTTIGMAAAGVALSPATGGASLGMTYGALSGAGMAALNGANFNEAMDAGQQGGIYGAVGGGLSAGAAALLGPIMPASVTSGAGMYADKAANIGINQLQYGVGGYGGAKGAGLSNRQAILFGLGSGAGAAFAGGAGAGTLLGAGVGGYGAMSLAGQKLPDSGGGGGGGNYQAPQSEGNPTAGGKKQASGTKSVPEAQFLDGGTGNWGNAGMGGVFGGLDNIRKKDSFVDANEIKNVYAQRGVGAFVK